MDTTTVTRAALDIGSGAIRCQVADVDVVQDKIVKAHFVEYRNIEFARDLKVGKTGCFSQGIMDDAIEKILVFKDEVSPFSPVDFRGIATEAFRMSKNADVFIQRIYEATGVKIKVVSHEEEALYGFYNAMSHSGLAKDECISWDSGAGSLQVAAHDGQELSLFLARLGRIPVQHYIVEQLQNRNFSDVHSPNPIQEHHVHSAIDYIKSQLKAIPETLRAKLAHPKTRVLSIGAHSKFIPENAEYSQEDIKTLLFTNCNKSDEELAIEDASFAISDLILEYSVMCALNIKKAYRLSTKSTGNTSGVLTHQKLWEPGIFKTKSLVEEKWQLL